MLYTTVCDIIRSVKKSLVKKEEQRMKKIISILVSFIIATSLFTGCANDNKDTVSKNNSSVNSASDSKKDSKNQNSDKSNYEKGTWEDKSYKNKSLNISFTLPENWAKVDAEDAKNLLMENVEENKDTNLVDKMNSYDFLINNETTGTNIQLLITDLAMVPGGKSLTDKLYLETVKNQFTSLADSDVKCSDITNKDICGQNYCHLKMEIGQEPKVNSEYYVLKKGNYMISFVCSYSEDNKAEYDSFINSLKPIA